MDRLVGRRRRRDARRKVQHHRVGVRPDVAVAPELTVFQLDFDRQLHGDAFFIQEVFRVQQDRRIRTGNFDRPGQTGEAFIDVFVVLFLIRLRPRRRREEFKQATGNGLGGFRQRIAVLGAKEFDFVTYAFESPLELDRIRHRKGPFAQSHRATDERQIEAIGDRRPTERAIGELSEFPGRIMRSRRHSDRAE